MYETADCRQLKYQIEELIRREKLTKWVVHEVKRHKSQGVGYHEVPPPRNRKLSPLQGAQETKVVMLLLGDHILGEIATSVWRCTFTRLRDFLSIMFITCRIAPLRISREKNADIMFTEEDAKWVHHPHSDALVVKIKIGTNKIYRVLVDNGSVANMSSLLVMSTRK